MKKNKQREIIAKFLLIVVLLTMPGMQASPVYAKDAKGKLSGADVKAGSQGGTLPDCYFGDLYLFNISLAEDYFPGQYVLECGMTNTGSEKFRGELRFCLYDENGFLITVIEMGSYDSMPLPGETKMTSRVVGVNILGAVTLVVQKKSYINNAVNTTAVFDNILEMYDIMLYPVNNLDEPEYWGIRFGLRALQAMEDTIQDVFQLNIFFKDELGNRVYQTSSQIEGKNLGGTYNFAIPIYDSVDLSNVCSIEISADFPTATPTPTATAQPTPTHTAENTSAPQPTRDVSVTAEPVSTPNIPGETEPSQAPGITPTERPATPTQGTQLPSQPASPTPSPTLPVTAKPSGTPVPTAQPQVPTPTRLPGTTDMPTASPTANPTQTPAVSKPGKTKLMRPVIRIKTRKIDNKMWMAEIRLKKYQGTDIQIYYRRGKGKFKKIKLRRHNIKKNKKIFKVGYKKGNKNIYLRVRTYQKKGGKTWYSRYSKIRRLS